MNNKLVLGTVQFGCQYGINSAGRPDEKTVLEILDLAYHSGITNLCSMPFRMAETLPSPSRRITDISNRAGW